MMTSYKGKRRPLMPHDMLENDNEIPDLADLLPPF
jgi:hypothetical protein